MDIQQIKNKSFAHSFHGYDVREVDAFLDDVAEELEKRESENKLMILRIEALLERIEALED